MKGENQMTKRTFTLGALKGSRDLYYNKVVFDQVVIENHKKMVEYVVRQFPVIGEDDAADLVQCVFGELCETIWDGIREERVPVESWLFERLRQRCIDRVRQIRKRTEIRYGIQEEDIPTDIPDTGSHPVRNRAACTRRSCRRAAET
jgi:DNA-directed RNA polymerase specialized sigma24 family protein